MRSSEEKYQGRLFDLALPPLELECGSTLNNTGGGDNQTSGASFRIIADTQNWDNSVGTSTPGQSGDPHSPHYRDLFDLWAKGKYFPIFFSRDKIESVTEKTIVLQPAG